MKLSQQLKPSFWQESLSPPPPCPALQGTQDTDIAIIGGGFVGLWTALRIKALEPDCRVALLEQHGCGSGASGRNGGFAMSWWPKITSLQQICGNEEALFLAQQSEAAITALGEFCARHGINAHFAQKGWLWTATTPAHMDSWEHTVCACEALGASPFQRLSAAEVRRRTGSPITLGGVFEKSNATVQPAALAYGIRQVALAQGIEIYENSGVSRIDYGAPVMLYCPQGTLRAAKVVFAHNAWAAAHKSLTRLVAAVNSSIVATRPLGAQLEEIGWNGGESVTDSQLFVDYYRTTRDGRIVFGKGTAAISKNSVINEVFSADPAGIALAKEDLLHTYPMLSPDCISHAWSGPIDRTYDSLPVFGHVDGQENLFFGIGWSGNGVSPSQLGGRILASLALGRDDEWSRCKLVGRPVKTFPPEPLRHIGGNWVRNAVIRKEKAELLGHPPSLRDRWLSRLAPSGLEDKS
ncbi:glycine/D-amino acid oxidase-like deaminating enzyme [Neisseria sp. HSC-16F19]|nr:FAD-binding oxidoreductase [Neisseria sp. HSC-16F19]MCP2039752.1 glycine/D-amino acid oxidase-like deaminating enzyme [Neisseria sp. HSC-16F19]